MAYEVLVVDDEHEVRRAIKRALERRGYSVVLATNGTDALQALQASTPDAVLTDISMPGLDGISLLRRMKDEGWRVPTLVMSGAATIGDAVAAVQLGAADFIEKPLSLERLFVSLERCLEAERLRDENAVLRRDARSSPLIGDAPAMRALRGVIERIAPTEARVLVLGENGTGKELVADAIHALSPRANGPLIKLNCSAIPRDLVESELFGHERGAFTGAVQQRRGRFELAHRGTLFLDEIADTPFEMQTKLLRVLQEQQLERVGGSRTIAVDVRVIAATNRDLPAMVAEGTFREDLFYRLNVVSIRTPPLRERREDIPTLADHFLREANRRHRVRAERFSEAALATLQRYDFPGNVRELSNLVERLAILADGSEIGASEVEIAVGLKPTASAGPAYREGATLTEMVDEFERRVLSEAITRHGSRAAAARVLGVERSFFYKKCKRYGIADSNE